MKKIILLLAMFVSLPLSMKAQTNDLTEEEIEAFTVQCLERIDAFQVGMEIIADKQQDVEVRDHYIRTLPEMFMGDGEAWTETNGQRHPAPHMQVAVVRYNTTVETTEYPIKEYLSHLKTLRWSSVKITRAKTCRISNFYKSPSGNRYEATATYYQYYEGSNGEGGRVYRDYTQKNVKVYLERIEDGQLGTYWELRFGDIDVQEVKLM